MAAGKKGAAAAADEGTAYTVLELRELREIEDGSGAVSAWVEIGHATSATKDGAIKTVAAEAEGIFKAVPTRSWKGAKKTGSKTVITTEDVDL